MRKFGILFLAAGMVILIIGIGIAAFGAYVMAMNAGLDPEGYTLSEVYNVETSTYAFAMYVYPYIIHFPWTLFDPDQLSQTKWVVTSNDPSKQVFIGWAWGSDGSDYLLHIMHEMPDNWIWEAAPYTAAINIESTLINNQGAPARTPSQETFWLDSASTPTTMYWDPSWPEADGLKILIIMNADGSAGVSASLQLGAKTPILLGLDTLLIAIGVILCIAGIIMFLISFPALMHRKKKDEK